MKAGFVSLIKARFQFSVVQALRRNMETFPSFYVSLPDKPVYLQCWDRKTTADLVAVEKDSDDRVSILAQRFKSLYILDPASYLYNATGDDVVREQLYVNSCLSAQSLYRKLVELEELSCFDFMLGVSEKKGMTRRQLYALLADDVSLHPTKIHSLLLQHGCVFWVYDRDDDKTSTSTQLWRFQDCSDKETVRQMPEVLAEANQTTPVSKIFQEEDFSPVFHDYERTIKVLNMYKDCPEVQQLLEISARELHDNKSLSQLVSMMQQPLVVVEGMDAIGKTTLTEFLEKKLEAARYSTPPPCLLPLRRFFDKLPEIVRRAYYSLGNYIVAQQVAAECQTRPVVMDRYWHSTAAYGIANESSLEDLPPQGHQDYCWPEDLLKPTAVIFLTVSEEVRRERLGYRHDQRITFEEKSLNKDQLFRKRLCEAYLMMREPACIPVNASGSKEEVVEAVLEQLRLHGIDLK